MTEQPEPTVDKLLQEGDKIGDHTLQKELETAGMFKQVWFVHGKPLVLKLPHDDQINSLDHEPKWDLLMPNLEWNIEQEYSLCEELKNISGGCPNLVQLCEFNRAVGRVRKKKLLIFEQIQEWIGSGGIPYTLEKNAGTTLEDKLKKDSEWRELSHDKKIAILRDVLCGVAYLHTKGYTHNDITPANIFVATDNIVRVGDYSGVQKMASREPQQAIKLGSRAIRAPETWSNQHHVSFRSDVFGLGVFIHAFLSGKHPFLGEPWKRTKEQGERLQLILENNEKPMIDAPSLVGLTDVVKRCLSHEAKDRYADAGELLRAFDNATIYRRRRHLIAYTVAAGVLVAMGWLGVNALPSSYERTLDTLVDRLGNKVSNFWAPYNDDAQKIYTHIGILSDTRAKFENDVRSRLAEKGIDPDRFLAEFYHTVNDTARAKEHYEKAIQSTVVREKNLARMSYAFFLSQQGDYDYAIKLRGQVRTEWPELAKQDVSLWHTLIHEQSKDYAYIGNLCESSKALCGLQDSETEADGGTREFTLDNVWTRIHLCTTYMENRRYHDAASRINDAIRVANALSNNARAGKEYQNAMLWARLRRLELSYAQGDNDLDAQAGTLYDDFVEAKQNYGSLWVKITGIRGAVMRGTAADSELEKKIDDARMMAKDTACNDGIAACDVVRALYLLRQDRPAEARACIEAARPLVRRAIDSAMLRLQLGRAYVLDKSHAMNAEEAGKRLTEASKELTGALKDVGSLHKLNTHFELEQAACNYYLMQAYRAQGDEKKAVAASNDFISYTREFLDRTGKDGDDPVALKHELGWDKMLKEYKRLQKTVTNH